MRTLNNTNIYDFIITYKNIHNFIMSSQPTLHPENDIICDLFDNNNKIKKCPNL